MIPPNTVTTSSCSPAMGSKVNSGLLVLAIFAVFLLRRQRRRYALAISHGCAPPVAYQPKEPLSGFDFQMRMYSHIPFLYELHQRYGETYQVRSWVSLPAICTIAPENIRAINMSKDFGVEPMRLPGLGYFCGSGFITTDGDTWKHARKLLKPSFDMSNIRDLSTLRGEVNSLLEQVPKDGSTIDLQPSFSILPCILFWASTQQSNNRAHPSQRMSSSSPSTLPYSTACSESCSGQLGNSCHRRDMKEPAPRRMNFWIIISTRHLKKITAIRARA